MTPPLECRPDAIRRKDLWRDLACPANANPVQGYCVYEHHRPNAAIEGRFTLRAALILACGIARPLATFGRGILARFRGPAARLRLAPLKVLPQCRSQARLVPHAARTLPRTVAFLTGHGLRIGRGAMRGKNVIART
jgi:hypothetical protein